MTFTKNPIGMDGDQHEQFDVVLGKLLSADNDTRSDAESVYETIDARNRLELLLTAVADTDAVRRSDEARHLSFVLLRRLFINDFDEIREKLSPDELTHLKHQMISIVTQSAVDKSLIKKTCDAVSELARNFIDDDANNEWPEILHFLFECINSQSLGLKECALNIFTTVPTIFGNKQSQSLHLIKQMLASCLSEQSEICFSAARAACSFLVANESDQAVLQHLKDLLPGILHAVSLSIQQQTDDMLLKCLIDVAENIPKYLRPQIENVLDLCIKVIENTDLEDSWRQLALEIVTTLAETASAMIRKHAGRIPQLVVLILRLMCDIEEEEDWSVQEEVEDDEADNNSVAAETALDRLACGLGGKTMLPQIIANIPPLLSSPDWKCRHAALMAISACGEGCHKQMEVMLGQILESIIPYTRDDHPRVRYAACNALGQMSTDFAPNLQKKYHALVLPALLSVLELNNDNPRVQAHSGAALVNFCEDCPKHIMDPYLEAIINKLAMVLNCKFNELVQRGNKMVLEQIVTTLATVADSVEDRFVDYYDQFIPSLKIIIENASDPSLRLLRGKTIECVSLIGLAVGRDKFLQDCEHVMRLLLASQTQAVELDDDDPQTSYLISAWARMCKILGKDFEQYLPMVMPPVLKAAAVKPEVALLDSDEMKGMEGDSDWQFVTLGDQQNFGIRTSGLEDKATACQMLVCYARELKQGFSPYTKQVTEIMVPLLKFYFHDDCRVAAAECLPYMLDCAQIQGDEYFQEMWNYILPHLLKSIESEPEKEIQAEIMNSLAQCIERMGKDALTETYMTELVQIITNLLEAHSKRQAERQEQRKDEDYDEDVEESLLNEDDEDVYVLSKISDIIHSLFGTMKTDFLPVFDTLVDHFAKLLKDGSPWPDRQWGLCIFDDVIEFTGAVGLKYASYFSGPIIKGLAKSQAPEVRQAAAYGVGVMAMFGENAYTEFIRETLPLLIQLIQESESRNLENINATENAISAATKIFKYAPGDLNPSEFVPLWLSWLPVWEDSDEALHIYSYLCDLFEAESGELFGLNGSNMPKIVSVIAQVFQKDILDKECDVKRRLKQCIEKLQSNVELITACIDQLAPIDKEALFKEMNS